MPFPRRFAAATLFLAGCATSAPDPSQQAGPEMAKVLSVLAAMNPIPIQTLPAAEARRQPSAAMAAQVVQRNDTGSASPLPPVASVRNTTIPGAGGPMAARIYNPRPTAATPLPVILYFQGGGWVIADLDTYDGGARGLAHGTDAIVVSVQYRKGPENRFPAAHDDAVAAWRWLAANAASIGGDPRRLALAGESAGGNLALATAIAARDGGLARPAAQILVYPVAGTSTANRSAGQYMDAKPLATPQLAWFVQNYVGDASVAANDPRMNPVERADLRNLPPTTIILAEIDPLRSGGERLGEKLQAAGTPVESRTFRGATHEFFGMAAVVPQAREAQAFAAARLRAAFGPGMVSAR